MFNVHNLKNFLVTKVYCIYMHAVNRDYFVKYLLSNAFQFFNLVLGYKEFY